VRPCVPIICIFRKRLKSPFAFSSPLWLRKETTKYNHSIVNFRGASKAALPSSDGTVDLPSSRSFPLLSVLGCSKTGITKQTRRKLKR
jgi:hypothetical protein